MRRVDRATEARLVKRLDELAANPYDPRLSKKLTGPGKLRTCRVGDWRVIFTVSETQATVHVLQVLPRGEAYRRV